MFLDGSREIEFAIKQRLNIIFELIINCFDILIKIKVSPKPNNY